MKLRCQACSEWIANFDGDELKYPFTSDMFKPKYEGKGVPIPFHPSLKMEQWICPICRKKPFSDRIHTDTGFIFIEQIPGRFEQEFNEINQKEREAEVVPEPVESPYLFDTDDMIDDKIRDKTCDICGHVCKSKAGVILHKKHHHK